MLESPRGTARAWGKPVARDPGRSPVDAITDTAARATLAQTMNRLCGDHEPLILTRNGQPSVVMLSLDDDKALEETAYLFHSPANARRLLDAIDSLEAGQGRPHALTDDDTE
jgi:antitoxin YefM